MLRLAGRILAVLLVREMRRALHAVQQLDLLVQSGQDFVRVAGAQWAGVALVRGPLRQLAGVDTGQQLADRAAELKR